MDDVVAVLAVLAVWWLLQVWLLPRFRPEPCRNRAVGVEPMTVIPGDDPIGVRLLRLENVTKTVS